MRRRSFLFRGRRRINAFADGMPDHREQRMCFGKRMMNKQQAIQMAAHMKKHLDAAETLTPFKCDVCKHWHVGNDNRRNSA